MREWGIYNNEYGGLWTSARSGQFLHVMPYWENEQTYESRGEIRMARRPRMTLHRVAGWTSRLPIFAITEMTAFVVRLLEEYSPGGGCTLVLRATAVSGKQLVSNRL